MMDNSALKQILLALLMSHAAPLPIERIEGVFDEWEKPTRAQLDAALLSLAEDYSTSAIELSASASGYCFQTRPYYATWITRLFDEKPVKYSNALLETLSIIAYKQPVTRADIEDIRGVLVSSTIIKTLLDREWIRITGHRDVPGKPALYTTTKAFLDYFNLASLTDLPPLDTVNHEQ